MFAMADHSSAVDHLPVRSPVPTGFPEGPGFAWQRGATSRTSRGPARAVYVPGPPLESAGPRARKLPARSATVTLHTRATHVTPLFDLIPVVFSAVDALLLPLLRSPAPTSPFFLTHLTSIITTNAIIGNDPSRGIDIVAEVRGEVSAGGSTASADLATSTSASAMGGGAGKGGILSSSITLSIPAVIAASLQMTSVSLPISPPVFPTTPFLPPLIQVSFLVPTVHGVPVALSDVIFNRSISLTAATTLPPVVLATLVTGPLSVPARRTIPSPVTISIVTIHHGNHRHRIGATAGMGRADVGATACAGGGPLWAGVAHGRPLPAASGKLIDLPIATYATTPCLSTRTAWGQASCRGTGGRASFLPRELGVSAWIGGSVHVIILAVPRLVSAAGSEKKVPLPTTPPMAEAMRAARSWVKYDAVAAYGTSALTVETPGAWWRAVLIRERGARVHVARPVAVVAMTSPNIHGEAAAGSSSSRRPSPSVTSDATMRPLLARARSIRSAEAKTVAARPVASTCVGCAVARGRRCNDQAPGADRRQVKMQDTHAHRARNASSVTAGGAARAAGAIRAGYSWPRLPVPCTTWLRWPRGRLPRHPWWLV